MNMPDSSMPEPFVSADVVARHVSIERRQVLALTRAGKLPGHPIDPEAARKTWRYRLSEVDRKIALGANRPPASVTKNGFGGDGNCDDNTGGSPRSRKEQSDG